MEKYYDRLNEEVKGYFNILSPVFPEWLLDYINTPEMQRVGKISMFCGADYSKCFNVRYWHSTLDHSVGVALIIWNFTHDKKQTIAGLFHDIATPSFKHCIDFMNGDSEHQESTEERTTEIIQNSKEIKALLDRDGIKLEEICNYKIYPIADNSAPQLAADRLEYNFTCGLSLFRVWDLDKIKKVYNDLTILKNEHGIDELGFKHKEIAEEYIRTVSKLWPVLVGDEDRTVMQFLADMCKSMNNAGYLTVDDLYTYSEQQIMDKILNCDDKYLSESFKNFMKATKVYKSDEPVANKYCVNVNGKARYVNPLVLTEEGAKRISDVSPESNKLISDYLALPKGGYYTYFDFDFKPYNERKLNKTK